MTLGKSLILAAMVSAGLTSAGWAKSQHEPHARHHHAAPIYVAPDGMSDHSATGTHPYRAGEGSATNDNLDIGNSGPN
ncbi:hypothetical protein [Beijerinckia indica]|uniref:Uncharacterized protein n=1 Tax=Beijerinckia indica subsp. indica (strain ATCC 9039 / DSM 1715 / NCIMB 8712) TaxID=395963 RepID=B2IHM6_BEII9|nr:hypothetical protein [Beijerinckia indica]ACB94547.1 hypothetical protein Bind_0898 [Beijerinckia indica subsp. indica ATCC 9039]